MIVNIKAIYTPHWFLSIHMFERYTTSRTGTKDCEIQLHLPLSKFIMVPINKSLILNSHCTKWIICRNVWKFNLKTIMFRHSYILDVQILSTNKLKISSLIWLIGGVGVVFINSVHYIIKPIKISTPLSMILKKQSPFIIQSITEMEIKM